MNKSPVISIILPTYNRAVLLKRALQSIFEQSFSDFELIIINDASTDGTRVFLDELAKKDARVRPAHHNRNYYPDISRTLNDGLKLARGKYIARLDDDDYWCDNDKLKKQIEFFDSHPDYVVVGGGTIVIDEKDMERFRYQKLETDKAIRTKALMANPFTHSTVMFRRDVALEVGGYGDFKNAEDWELWLKMGTRGKFYNFQEYFTRYLMTEQSKSFLFKRSQSKEILRIVRAHKKEYPNFLPALMVNFAQYCYSFLSLGARRASHLFLSKMKRGI
ncbi:MAG: glycosyltransferase [bacterium]|nr:glycosyltransferase [bacterium]